MRIVFATSSFRGGGITSYAQEFIHNYSKDNSVSVIVGDDSFSPIVCNNVDVYHYEGSDLSYKNALNILKLVNETIKPDVLINSNSLIVGLLIPFFSDSVRIITVSHSQRYIEADLAAFNHKYTDSVVALSGFNKAYLDKKFHVTDKHKINVVYNFVREGHNTDIVLDKKKMCTIPKIVYMGGSIGAKSPELVFRILRDLLKTNFQFKFYWLGADTPPLKKIQPFKSVAELLPNDNRVVFTHRIPRDEAMAISSSANIFLIPSRREGCPMALLEAMRYGVIAITSDYKNACRELVIDGYNGKVISHKNYKDFVKSIELIISNMADYEKMYYNSLDIYKRLLCYEAWKKSMDLLVYNSESNHVERKVFGKTKFSLAKIRFKILNVPNSFNKLVSETIPSALSFLMIYIKSFMTR